jgi:site-specific DNA recombinase
MDDRSADLPSLAKQQGVSEKPIRATLSLAFLAPDIVEAAIEGRLNRGLTVTQMTGLPSDWKLQRQALGLT